MESIICALPVPRIRSKVASHLGQVYLCYLINWDLGLTTEHKGLQSDIALKNEPPLSGSGPLSSAMSEAGSGAFSDLDGC